MPSESRLSEALSNLNPLRRRSSLAQSLRSIASNFSRKSKDGDSIKSNWDADSHRSDRHSLIEVQEANEPKEEPPKAVVKEVKKGKSKKNKGQSQSQSKPTSTPAPAPVSVQPAFVSKKKRERTSSSYQSYKVHRTHRMPAILRDSEATKKLLDTILDLPGGRRSLSRLARTCKAFSEPALDTLWREIDSLVPLIGLFPTTLLKKARKPGLGLVKAPSEEDWSRVILYGERVRQVTYNEGSNAVSPSIFPHLEANRPRVYMFPNLQQLVWKTETSAGLDHCEMFLNPSLEGLTLEIGARSPRLVPLLVDVAQRMGLTSFSITSQIALPESFVDILDSQDALQKLTLIAPGALSPAVGHWVASLPELKSLQLDLSRRSPIAVEGFFDDLPGSGASTPSSVGDTDSGVFSGDELDFSDLRKSALKLTGDLRPKTAFSVMRQLCLTGEAPNVAVFLRYFTSPLTSLDIVIDEPPEKGDWQELSQMIGHFSPSLQALRISATGSRFSDLARSTMKTETPTGRLSLEYIPDFPVLNRLEIELPDSVYFVAADVRKIASMCPNLEELRLCALARFPVQTGPPKLTLEDLAPLMSECPRLNTIAVAINGKKGSPEIMSDPKFSSESMRKFHFGHSWINDPLHVAILISHLAPKLDNLKWFHERNRPGFIETNARGWEKVSDMLPHIQEVRISERARAAEPKQVKVIEYVEVVPPPVPTANKSVGSEIVLVDQGVLVRPVLVESSTQCSPQVVDAMVAALPETVAVEIDATPAVEEIAIDSSLPVVHEAVDATPNTLDASVDATPLTHSDFETPLTHSKSIEVLAPPSPQRTWEAGYHVLPYIFNMLSFTWRIVAWPMSIPMRIIHAILYNSWVRRLHQRQPRNTDSASSSSQEETKTLL